jgi:hypothetical protein
MRTIASIRVNIHRTHLRLTDEVPHRRAVIVVRRIRGVVEKNGETRLEIREMVESLEIFKLEITI